MEQMGGPSEMMLKMKMEVHVYGVLPVGIIPGTADGACLSHGPLPFLSGTAWVHTAR